MDSSHTGHRERLRKRVKTEGLDNFESHQVLEYVLTFVIPYKDTNELAHRLINKFGSFAGVLDADEDELCEVDGMGKVASHFLSSLTKIMGYYEKDKLKFVEVLTSPKQTYNYMKKVVGGKEVEELYLICLTPKNKIACVEKISSGISDETSAPIRKIVEKCLKSKENNAIITHNHPKGNAEPSADDDKFTKVLITALSVNKIHLLDHVIVGEDDYYSYRASGKIDDYKQEVSQFVDFRALAQNSARYEVDSDKE